MDTSNVKHEPDEADEDEDDSNETSNTTSASGDSHITPSLVRAATHKSLRAKILQVTYPVEKLLYDTLSMDEFLKDNYKALLKAVMSGKVGYKSILGPHNIFDYMAYFMNNYAVFDRVCKLLKEDPRKIEDKVNVYIQANFGTLLNEKNRTKQMNGLRRLTMNMYFYKQHIPFDLDSLFFAPLTAY